VKIIIDLEKETVNDLNLAISKIQEEINRRKSVAVNSNVKNKSSQEDIKVDLTEMLLKNKNQMLKNQKTPKK